MDADRSRWVTLLYLEALALPTEERVAFLDSACGDDAGLRHTLESMLADTSTDGISTVASPGWVLGHYRIERLLGRGGMASVYLAHDLKHRRTVAIKVLTSQIAAAVGTVRFLREIEIAARLVHPHILPLFDSGAAGDQLFYVMPHVEGGSLRARLQHDAPLPLDDALRLAREVAGALGHAHGQGFIHRDIKPENILLSDGMALVADFGIARVMSASGAERVTGTGVALGNASLHEPRAGAGHRERRRTRRSLQPGVCAVRDVGRRAAVQGTRDDGALATLHRNGAGRSASSDLAFPDAIERVIAKALAKAPDDRYATAAQFAEALIAGAMGTPVPAPSTSTHAVTPHNLPPQHTSFVGARKRVGRVRETVAGDATPDRDPASAGGGKTRLALKLAETMLASYPDGAWFVDLAPLSHRSGVVDALAVALAVRGEPGRDLAETLCRRVRGKQALLVLDNCEHLLDSTREVVDALLGAGNELRILITSREGLGLDGERAFPVRSLPVPEPESAGDLQAVEASAAVRLFVDRARIVDPDFALTMENAAGVADICRRLDGIPLAIELAAARVKVLSVEEIRAKLDDRFRLLTGGKKALPRHQTLWSVFEWSYDHLTPDEQRLFRVLSVFADGWTMAAATAVSSEAEDEFEILELLTRLVDKSLVVVERVAPEHVRYRLLETSRQFAQQKLHDAGEGEAERRRHLEYFARWAEAREPLAVGPQRGQWLVDMEREHQNIHAALEWSDAATGGAEPALRLVAAVWRYWPTRGLSALGRERLTQALGRPGAAAPTAARARALSGAGRLAQRQGALAEARVLLEESLSLCNRFGDHTGMARALNNLGLVCSQQGDHDGACARFEESLALARRTGDRRGASMTLNNLAEQARSVAISRRRVRCMRTRSPRRASAATRETSHCACRTSRSSCCRTGTRRGRADSTSKRCASCATSAFGPWEWGSSRLRGASPWRRETWRAAYGSAPPPCLSSKPWASREIQ
jgi:non-specific serine/threonine protein kinase